MTMDRMIETDRQRLLCGISDFFILFLLVAHSLIATTIAYVCVLEFSIILCASSVSRFGVLGTFVIGTMYLSAFFCRSLMLLPTDLNLQLNVERSVELPRIFRQIKVSSLVHECR